MRDNDASFSSIHSCPVSQTGGAVDNYIIRIYRREKDNPRLLVGLIEEIGVSGKKAFNNLDDLWEILNRKENVTTRHQKFQRNKKERLRGGREE